MCSRTKEWRGRKKLTAHAASVLCQNGFSAVIFENTYMNERRDLISDLPKYVFR